MSTSKKQSVEIAEFLDMITDFYESPYWIGTKMQVWAKARKKTMEHNDEAQR